MSVHVPIDRSVSDAHRAATDDVNRWRGHCIESYARLEREVTTTLAAMAMMPESKLSVPHNFGDKVKSLRVLLEPGGHFARPKLARDLDAFFADHLGRRNLLVHATGKVMLDVNGNWIWSFRFLPSAKDSQLICDSFKQDEAHTIEKSLARRTQSLGGQLRALRQELKAVTK